MTATRRLVLGAALARRAAIYLFPVYEL